MAKLKVVEFGIVCTEAEADTIRSEFYNSHLAQQGIYTLGSTTRDITDEEMIDVKADVPTDILENALEE